MRRGCEDVPGTGASDPLHASRGVIVPCAPRNRTSSRRLRCCRREGDSQFFLRTKRRTRQSHACRNGAIRAKARAKRKGAEMTRRAQSCAEKLCSALPALQSSHRGVRQQRQVPNHAGIRLLDFWRRRRKLRETHVLRAAVFIRSRAMRRARDRLCGHVLEGTENDENALPRSFSK